MCSCDGSSWAVLKDNISVDKGLIAVGPTHNPILVPITSKNEHALCRVFSSCVTESFPRCFSERNSTSAGVKYGWWYREVDVACEEGDWRPDCMMMVEGEVATWTLSSPTLIAGYLPPMTGLNASRRLSSSHGKS